MITGTVKDVKFDKKYILVIYDVFDGDQKIDEHSLQYEAGTEIPDEKSVRAALKQSLLAYKAARDLDKEKLIRELKGIEENA